MRNPLDGLEESINPEGSLAALLKRTAQDLTHHFSQLELIHDWAALGRLGSGILWIDLASGKTHHNGRQVEPLHIAGYLQSWLRESLAGANLSKTNTQDAGITARLTVKHYSGQPDLDSEWVGNPTRFVGCIAEVRCRLAVDGVSAEARTTEKMEWPDPDAA
jgi:hypothetical protein